MNERFKLDSEQVRIWLDREDRKHSFLSKRLGVGGSTVDRMLSEGHVPKSRTLTKLAELMGVEVFTLLIPKEVARRSA